MVARDPELRQLISRKGGYAKAAKSDPETREHPQIPKIRRWVDRNFPNLTERQREKKIQQAFNAYMQDLSIKGVQARQEKAARRKRKAAA